MEFLAVPEALLDEEVELCDIAICGVSSACLETEAVVEEPESKRLVYSPELCLRSSGDDGVSSSSESSLISAPTLTASQYQHFLSQIRL